MDQQTRQKLADKGWKVGTVSDFLELSPEETILVDIKLALSHALKERIRILVKLFVRDSYSQSQPRL